MKKNDANVADDTLRVVLNKLGSSQTRCVDVETSGLDWKRNHIVGYVVTTSPDPRDSHYVPFRHRDGGNVGNRKGPQTAEGWNGELAPGEKELVRALDQPGTMAFGHNFGFDIKFMSRTGWTFKPRHEDTQVNAPLINELAGRFSLQACAERAKVQTKKVEIIKDHIRARFSEASDRDYMGHYWRLRGDDPVAVEYAAGDGTSTWQLRYEQMKEILNDGVDPISNLPTSLERVWDIESRLIPALARMTVKGIKIDVDYLNWLKDKVASDVEKLMNEFPSGFGARSPDDVRAWMEKHGHTDWPLTPKKQAPSFPEAWLERTPAGQKIIAIRKLENLNNSFVIPLLDTHIWNGRVHSNYNQLQNDEYGTITGRLSSDSPNVQQVPKHNEKLGRMFRRAFIPDDGMLWESADFNQIEPRLLAYYSRCKVLMDGYSSDPPIDAHSAAAEACNSNWGKMNDAERKHYRNAYAKRINQTIITGGGKGVLVNKYGIDPGEIDRIWNDYHSAMPEVRRTQKRMQQRMKRRGYMITLLGRHCRLQGDRAYVALNRILQGGNADVIKTKMVECDEYLDSVGRPIDMLINCHDAVEFQAGAEHRAVFNECLRIMQSFGKDDIISLDLPMPVDVGEGRDWSEATYGPDKSEKAVPKARKRTAA